MSELGALAGLLSEKTLEGKVKWTVDNDNRMHAFLGDNIIELSKFWDYDKDHALQLALRNIDGIVLLQEEIEPFHEKYQILSELMHYVRRDALKVHEALSDLRSKLEAL